ncbi:hypothetical protein RHIZO_04481 [Rhizobiaceae bacterium]|nr:hypothetical protein RHIZO_04481 [Rhizobiaceae bacterium]
MSAKITPDHLARAAVIYVRQSTMSQVTGNLESQRRQYDLAGAAEAAGFASVTVIDDDLGRSGSGAMQRPGFERLVAMVCSGDVGAVYCIEASRLARNGRDWHHLIDLCALAGTLVVDPDGAYDPRLVNDRLLLGLKGTMSEYELSLMRQRGIAARDSKAKRGEFRFMLPPGFSWSGFRIRRIGLATLYVGLHVGRRDQPHLMAESGDLARPVMRSATCLHADQAWCELAKEAQHLAAPQLAAHDDMTFACDTVDLEERLRQVQPDRANLFHGTVLSYREATRPSLGT